MDMLRQNNRMQQTVRPAKRLSLGPSAIVAVLTIATAALVVAPTLAVASTQNDTIAGTYCFYDPFGYASQLILDVDGQYTYTYADVGNRRDYQGAYQMSEGLVELQLPDDATMTGVMPNRLNVVRWTDRIYLIADEDIPTFVVFIKKKWEPRKSNRGCFLLRAGDWTTEASGSPIFPWKWSLLLRERTVDAKIVQILSDSTASIDRGASHGLEPGMLLLYHVPMDGVIVPGRGSWVMVEIASVEPSLSVIRTPRSVKWRRNQRVSSKP